MILKCKQKIEYECMIYSFDNLYEIIPFLRNSTNLHSITISPDDTSLNVKLINSDYERYELEDGDYIVKNSTGKIELLSKDSFDIKYSLISEEDK